MNPSSRLLTLVLFLIVIPKIIYASFGACVAVNGPTDPSGRSLVGFHVWSDHGDEAYGYHTVSVPNGRNVFQDSNWQFQLIFNSSEGYIDLVGWSVFSWMWGVLEFIPFESICKDYPTNPRIYYSCLTTNNDPLYCQMNNQTQMDYCRHNVTTGAELGDIADCYFI